MSFYSKRTELRSSRGALPGLSAFNHRLCTSLSTLCVVTGTLWLAGNADAQPAEMHRSMQLSSSVAAPANSQVVATQSRRSSGSYWTPSGCAMPHE
jgi:hypothetical protein